MNIKYWYNNILQYIFLRCSSFASFSPQESTSPVRISPIFFLVSTCCDSPTSPNITPTQESLKKKIMYKRGMVTILVNFFSFFNTYNAFNNAILISNLNLSTSRRVLSKKQSSQIFIMRTKFMSCYSFLILTRRFQVKA